MWNPNVRPGDTSSGETNANRGGSLHGEPQKHLVRSYVRGLYNSRS